MWSAKTHKETHWWVRALWQWQGCSPAARWPGCWEGGVPGAGGRGQAPRWRCGQPPCLGWGRPASSRSWGSAVRSWWHGPEVAPGVLAPLPGVGLDAAPRWGAAAAAAAADQGAGWWGPGQKAVYTVTISWLPTLHTQRQILHTYTSS